MTPIEILLGLGLAFSWLAIVVLEFRVTALTNEVWATHTDVSEQVDVLIETKELPKIQLVRAWRKGLADSKKDSPQWHAYRNRLNEYGLL